MSLQNSCQTLHLFNIQVLADDDDEPDQDKHAICSKLSSSRSSYYLCCSMPIFYSQAWMVKDCQNKCASWTKTNPSCCVKSCLHEKKGILKYERAGNESVPKVRMGSWEGIVESFMMGFKNDSGWLPIISNSAQFCFNQFANQDLGYNCAGLIPVSIVKTIDCCFKQNFLNCAYWNPYEKKGCENTRQYVENCIQGVRFRSQMPTVYREIATRRSPQNRIDTQQNNLDTRIDKNTD